MTRAPSRMWSSPPPATSPPKKRSRRSSLLREHFPDLKIRFINVVDLFRLTPPSEHPHGLSDRDFDTLFTENKPIIFNFHGYPWLIHRLTYRRTNHKNMHVRGYKEKGNINTPLDLAIRNQIDRFTIAMDVIDRVPALRATGAHAKEKFRVLQLECQAYAYEHGIDKPEIDGWTWPASTRYCTQCRPLNKQNNMRKLNTENVSPSARSTGHIAQT